MIILGIKLGNQDKLCFDKTDCVHRLIMIIQIDRHSCFRYKTAKFSISDQDK